jgi:glycosyltransferase involved in cell wall biosynthesis
MSTTAVLQRTLPRVYLSGPIAMGDEPARGGFQACNRRTIAALRDCGLEVLPLPYPHPKTQGLRKLLEYAAGFLALYARALCCRRGSIFHITAVGVHFIYLEYILVRIAQLAGCRVVFDIRAGAARAKYDSATQWFRFVFRRTLRAADLLMVEGQPFQGFIEEVAGRRPIHLPNHLDTAAIEPRTSSTRLPSAPTLIYVGRIVPEKGIETALQAVRALHAEGFAASMQIVGEGKPEYLARLRADYADVGTEWLGPLPPDAVIKMLSRAHFFLFPSRHFGEGQSNALTEAMACGVVPIASKQGFNEAVTGEAGVTLAPMELPEAYADAVRRIWEDGSWPSMSALAQARARAHFSTSAVVYMLRENYRRLAGL